MGEKVYLYANEVFQTRSESKGSKGRGMIFRQLCFFLQDKGRQGDDENVITFAKRAKRVLG